MNALTIKNFSKEYRGGTKAVDELNLEVKEGDFFGLLGPNGAGKSTTIHSITGIVNPTGGSIEVFGKNVVSEYREARALVGLSPQEFNADIFATPVQILDWMGGYYGMSKKDRKERIEVLLDQFNLRDHKKKMFRMLSGGLKRRVLLARAMMNSPKLLILDEPTAGVDVELRRELWQHLQDLNKEGVTIILTSHYLEEVEKLCKTIAIISDGKVAKQGDKHDFFKEPGGLESAYLEITKK
tara:strand:- start:957 stop:1676 length:720 start_codon:yes stop_codon:yes gene_type:complete